MLKRISLKYNSVFLLSFVFMMASITYFIYTLDVSWQDVRVSSLLKRLDVLNQASVEGVTVEIKANEKSKDGRSTNGPNPCGENKIYFSNEFYDCDGLMKAEGDDEKETNDEEGKQKNGEDVLEKQKVPTRFIQMIPTSASKIVKNKDAKSRDATSTKNETNAKTGRHLSSKKFVNCGGTFPWAVELFLDTYPSSSTYKIFTFLPDPSYSIMYSQLPNHTVILSEASYTNGTQITDMKSFGSGSEITQVKVQTDMAVWLKANTKPSDYVILRIESEDDVKILMHLIRSKAVDHIDKLYVSKDIHAPTKDVGDLQTTLKQHKLEALFWDNKFQTYSDFDVLNPKHIPSAGKYVTSCIQKADKEKFALLMMSTSASVNSLRVISILQKFSPNDRLRVTVFLPYQTFKSELLHVDTLFETFQVGMYIDFDEFYNSSDVKLQFNLIKRKLTFGRRLFDQNGNFLQYVFAGNKTDKKIIKEIRENIHYSVIQGGRDITHVFRKVLSGQTVFIDDTGKRSGDFLLINIDKPNAQYLALYMLRRFAPWLLTLSECDVFNASDPSE